MIKVKLSEEDSVEVVDEVSTAVVVMLPSELVGVRVEVVTMMVVEGVVVGVMVDVDDSVMTVGLEDVGGSVVGVVVGSSLDVGVEVVDSVTPVDRLTD